MMQDPPAQSVASQDSGHGTASTGLTNGHVPVNGERLKNGFHSPSPGKVEMDVFVVYVEFGIDSIRSESLS